MCTPSYIYVNVICFNPAMQPMLLCWCYMSENLTVRFVVMCSVRTYLYGGRQPESRKWPNNGHEIAWHSTHYNLLARTHH